MPSMLASMFWWQKKRQFREQMRVYRILREYLSKEQAKLLIIHILKDLVR